MIATIPTPANKDNLKVSQVSHNGSHIEAQIQEKNQNLNNDERFLGQTKG